MQRSFFAILVLTAALACAPRDSDGDGAAASGTANRPGPAELYLLRTLDGKPLPYRLPTPDSAACGWSIATGQFSVASNRWSVRQVRLDDCEDAPDHARAATYRVSGRFERHGDTLHIFVRDTGAAPERDAGVAVLHGDTLLVGSPEHGDARGVYVRAPLQPSGR